MIYDLGEQFPDEFMVFIANCEPSSIQHDIDFVNYGPIRSKIDDKPRYALGGATVWLASCSQRYETQVCISHLKCFRKHACMHCLVIIQERLQPDSNKPTATVCWVFNGASKNSAKAKHCPMSPTSSTLWSVLRMLWLQNNKMAKHQTQGFKTLVHKPVGDVTVGSHCLPVATKLQEAGCHVRLHC